MASEPTPEQSYCADQARRNDWDRFICALFAPSEARETLYALIAFNAELARTRSLVSEPMLGQIRLQWWRDAIAATYDGPTETETDASPPHPILAPLARAIRACSLNRASFDAMIDARSDELYGGEFNDAAEVTAYAEATSGNLARLQIAIIGQGVNPADPTIHAADEVAIAWGIVELIRSGRIAPDHADDVPARIAAARLSAGGIERRFLSVLLPATLAQTYIRRPKAGRLHRQIALGYKAFRGKF